MELIVNKKLNATTSICIKFDGERDVKDALLKATPFMQMKMRCGFCNSDDVELQARQTKDSKFIYVELACRKCNAKLQFGEYNLPRGALYLKQWGKDQSRLPRQKV